MGIIYYVQKGVFPEAPNLFGLSSWYQSDTKYIHEKRRALFVASDVLLIDRMRNRDIHTHRERQQFFFRSSFPFALFFTFSFSFSNVEFLGKNKGTIYSGSCYNHHLIHHLHIANICYMAISWCSKYTFSFYTCTIELLCCNGID